MPSALSVTAESEPLVVESATVPPDAARLLPNASLSWTVTAEVEVPFAVIEPGAATIVDSASEGAAAFTVIAPLVPVIELVGVSVAVTVCEPVVFSVYAFVKVWTPAFGPVNV